MNNITTNMWMIKHRPEKISEIILPKHIKDDIYKWIENNNFPHLILIGTPGIGKTSLANVLINELNASPYILNASDERGIGTIRDGVKRFAMVSSNKLKIVFLDEADRLTSEAQESLRNIIEKFSNNTRFIFTGNSDNFTEAIKDRCTVIKFNGIDKQSIYGYLSSILDKEGINHNSSKDIDYINYIIDKEYPSIRSMVNILENSIVDGKINESKYDEIKNNNEFFDRFMEIFEYGSTNDIREYLIKNNFNDWDKLYRHLFDNVNDDFSKLVIAEFLYRNSFSIDPEVNFHAMIISIKSRIIPFSLIPNETNKNDISLDDKEDFNEFLERNLND